MTDNPKHTAEQTAANRKKWTDALRSGRYKQGRGTLVNFSDGVETPRFCCLGVACDVAAVEGIIPARDGRRYAGEGLQLPEVVREWLGIEGGEGNLKDSVAGSEASCLSNLNDHYEYDFNQLADVIDNGGVRLTEEL